MIGLILLPFYILFNIYLNNKIIKWINLFITINNLFKYILLSIQLLLTLSLYIALLLPHGNMKKILNIIGNYYLGIMIYVAITLILLFIINLIFKNSINNSINNNIHIIEGFIAIILVVFITIYGNINSSIIHTTKYEVSINKKSNLKELKIVMVADMHLGYNKGLKLVKDMVSKINKEKPDIVLMAGDTFDNDYDALDRPNLMIKELKKIKTKYGVYSVYGNHDVKENIILGFTFQDKKQKYSDTRMDDFLKRANIKILDDEYVLIGDIYIYGRPDYAKYKNRKSVNQMIKNMDTSKPIIVVDHQPKELDKLSKANVDLDLSGHTHDGQIFPLSLLVKLAYKNSCGIKKFNNMTSIVTSGVGLYGPNMRVLTKAEITSINVKFK